MDAVGSNNSTSPDQRALDSLRSQAARDPRGAARQTAVQFESLFNQMVLKSMRDATPQTETSQGQETFTAMLDQQFSRQLAGRPGGLADMLEKQLTQHMQKLPEAAPANLNPPVPDNLTATTPAAPAQATAPATAPTPRNRAEAFLQQMLPYAQEAERQTGVPASFILGQAGLESGWGKGEIRNPDGSNSYNLFGIKATRGWEGASTSVTTTEYAGGNAYKHKAAFRSYGSYSEAFADYARLLASHPRYGNVVRQAGTAEAFAGGMQRAGYATDPHYASKLARTIHMAQSLQRATPT
ncbi:flagellar assembly peptidoglycan hydrolase FlgJ [Ramlibacter sp. G-1-2-2]|uniref:Peptidoglycan hydrolase FlgJ n=1 Tax=Ramlibacter agri TaxID=2728837 RepID=A0A848H1I7_9BURK|nr:flagellar assembly peptidoglycan hydrolase FlgJ [Ramlibacter agri]NML43441.1 flagellar assembly peptidoglycan hydrolase FlgJ [Ramlibacter agri]